MESPESEIIFKVIIIGDSGVGKTQLLNRIINNTFSKISQPTLGIDFKKTTIDINNKWVTINFWDTAGQEQYKAINKSFYKNALGGILVCDITNSDSLSGLDKWVSDFKKSADEAAPFIIIGRIWGIRVIHSE
jgi:small GTP-binding protein